MTDRISAVNWLLPNDPSSALHAATKQYVDALGTASAAAYQPLDSDLTAIAGLSPTNNDVLQRKSGAWINRSMSQLKTDLALTESDVSGLVTDLAGKAASVHTHAYETPWAKDSWTGSDGASWSFLWSISSGTGSATIASNQGKHLTGSGTYTWASNGFVGPSNGELLLRWKWVSTNAERYQQFIFRSDSGASNCYSVEISPTYMTLFKYIGDVQTTLATISASPAADTWYWTRIQFVGDKLSAKFWADGTDEPDDWSITYHDSAFVSGYVELFSVNGAAGGALETRFDEFSLWDLAPIPHTHPGDTTTAVSARIRRAGTSSVGSASGARVLTSVMDTTVRNDGCVVDLTNAKITVPVDGWYIVTCNVRQNTTTSQTSQALIYVNGTETGDGVQIGGVVTAGIQVVALLYLNSGDYVQAGVYTSITTGIVGHATSDLTSLAVTFISAPMINGLLSHHATHSTGGGDAIAPADIGAQPSDSDLTAIAAIAPSNDDVIQRKAGAWTNRTIAQVKTDLALSNVLNVAQQRALTKTATKTASTYTAADGDIVVCDTSSNAITVTLPTATDGAIILVTKINTGTNKVILAKQAGDTWLSGAPTSMVIQGASRWFYGYSGGWVQAVPEFTVKQYPIITLTDGATPALDASLGTHFHLTAAGNRTIGIPSSPTDGQIITIEHNASGGARTLSLNTGTGGFAFGSSITALDATASGKTDILQAIYNTTANKWWVTGWVKGF